MALHSVHALPLQRSQAGAIAGVACVEGKGGQGWAGLLGILQRRLSSAAAHLIECGEDDPNEASIQLLVGSLSPDVHVAGQNSDVWVRVVPPNDPDLHAALF